MPSLVVDHLLNRTAPPLAEDVRFAGPFAEYVGRERIGALLAVMPDVLVDERRDADGAVADMMIMIRPLRGTKAAIARMGELLGSR